MEKNKTGIIIGIIIAVFLIIGMLPIWGDSSSDRQSIKTQAAQCGWCNGTGKTWDGRSKDSKGNYIFTTCSHCHGTGLR